VCDEPAIALLHPEPQRDASGRIHRDAGEYLGGRRAGIDSDVDQPQIVVSTGPNKVSLDEFNRWASPLQNNIARVVAEDLVALLGTPRVSLFQQSLNADAEYRVAIEVQRFESAPGEAATLNAVWIVRRTKDGKAETGRTSIREPAGEKGFDALAAAHSRARAVERGHRGCHSRLDRGALIIITATYGTEGGFIQWPSMPADAVRSCALLLTSAIDGGDHGPPAPITSRLGALAAK
jgi:hypothetical protein